MGQPSYSLPSRLTPSQAASSRWEYQALHWTPSDPSETPNTPSGPLPNRVPVALDQVFEETGHNAGPLVENAHSQRTPPGNLRTTTLATSSSSNSMNAASPLGPKASGIAVAPAR